MEVVLSHRSLLNHDCPECGKKKWQVRKFINRGGHVTYPYVCGVCSLKTDLYEKKNIAIKMDTSNIEIRANDKRNKCCVCGHDGAENHHWAPSYLFGVESGKWPTNFLCIGCHNKWHRIVTPTMSRNN